MAIKNIAIVGGGTAGWLAANHLGTELSKIDGITITLIESPDIPPIGVGEGTVPTIRESLKKFGISEGEFIRTCEVTFKQSIKFVNWMDEDHHKNKYPDQENAFHHLFDAPSPFGKDLSEHWLAQSQNNQTQKCYANFVSPQFNSCEKYKGPKTLDTPEFQGAHGYAYHLNAAKFAQLLAKNAIEKFNVKHVLANVCEVELAIDGEISALHTKESGRLEFDFFIDCTGFEGLLMEKALKVPFVSKSKELLVNKALVVQVPTEKDDEIPPFTIATAHQAGWIWDIALTNRRGVGLVYSDNHMSDKEASDKLDNYLGNNAKGLSYRTLSMRIGHSEKFWHKNCVVLGLAQGFLEPLEATSILLTDFAASFLARKFPKNKADMEVLAQRFNQVMDYAWLRVIDFIKLHYYLSDRRDSQFWLDNQKDEVLTDSLKQRLELWHRFTPHPDDFFAQFEVFNVDNYLYLLYGMNYPTVINKPSCEESALAIAHAEKVVRGAAYIEGKLPQHRDIINHISRSVLSE